MRMFRVAALGLFVAAGCHGTDDAHCFLADVDPEMIVTSVQVDTVTGESGTDSDVYLDVELQEGADLSLYLDNSDDTFERGATESFQVAVSAFRAGNVAALEMRKESSLFESGDWDLDGLTITFVDETGGQAVAYDNAGHVERMTGDETHDLRCF